MSLTDSRMRQVFREVFADREMAVWDEMSASDVPGWDSLAQVKLIIGLEEEFGIKFKTDEVARLTSVADLKRALLLAGIASGGCGGRGQP